MFNLLNMAENYGKLKEVLIEEFTLEYGEEFREEIINKVNCLYMNLDSTPDESFKYAKQNRDNIDEATFKEISRIYEQYKAVDEESRNFYVGLLKNYIKSNSKKSISEMLKYYIPIKFKTKSVDMDSSESQFKLELLFDTLDFSCGYLDCFSKKSIDLLNDSNVPIETKNNILFKQKECKRLMKELGLNIDYLNSDFVDEFIDYRTNINKQYKNSLIKNTEYGKKIYNDLKRFIDGEIYLEVMDILCFQSFPYAFVFNQPKTNKMWHMIKYPMVALYNKGLRGLDVSLIHELIHKIERNNFDTGIRRGENNRMANEIRTQMLAIKITKRLHEKGIFIYDNPNDYKIENECAYEKLFPLCYDFFLENENFINKCAIKNDVDKLVEEFGESWLEFSNYLDYLWSLFENCLEMNLSTDNFITNEMLEKSQELIDKMNEHYREKNFGLD